MQCPNCGSKNLRVLENRHVTDSIYRQRKCKDCYHIFYTAEFICEFDDMYEEE